MAKAATAWSLGNDGSGEGGASSTVSSGCAWNGRSRAHRCEMAWLAPSPSAAAASPERQATRHRYGRPGRSRSQSESVARAYRGTAQTVTKSSIQSPSEGCPRRGSFRRWKRVQSIAAR